MTPDILEVRNATLRKLARSTKMPFDRIMVGCTVLLRVKFSLGDRIHESLITNMTLPGDDRIVITLSDDATILADATDNNGGTVVYIPDNTEGPSPITEMVVVDGTSGPPTIQ